MKNQNEAKPLNSARRGASSSVARLVFLALLAAMSIVLIYLIRVPLFPAAPWLEYDPADVPLMIASFMYGPFWGLAVTAVAAGIQAVTISASSGIIGFVMHLVATGAYVVVSGLIYSKSKKTLGSTILALAAGFVVAVALMIPLNLILTPLYGTPVEVVKELIFPVLLPFNLIRFGANSIITALLYRSLGALIRKKK